MSTFEDRLWTQLVTEHQDRMRAPQPAIPPIRHKHPRSRPALLTGTALATATVVLAAVLILSASTSAPPAYAVTTNRDGTVTVTLNDISAITGLNAELARDRINAQAIPMTANCPDHAPLVTMPAGTDPSTYTMTIFPSQIPAGYTAVLAVGQTASGRVELLQGALRPPVPACVNSTPTVFHYLNPADASPAARAAIARARRAVSAAKR